MEREKIFVNLPYYMVDERFDTLLELKVQPEFYFPAEELENLDFSKLRAVASELKKRDLRCTIHAPFYDLPLGSVDPLIREAVLKRYETLVPVLEILEPLSVVIHTGYDRWRYNSKKDVWMENAKITLETVLKMFPQGVKIAVENVFDESPEVLHELLSGFDERVGICFDVGHFQLFSISSLDEWLHRIDDRIIQFHLHDNDGREDRHWAIGEGGAPVYTLLSWARKREILHVIEAHTVEGVLKSLNFLLNYQ